MQDKTTTAIAWSVVGAFLVADLIWLPLSRLAIAPSTLALIAVTSIMLAVLLAVPPLVRRRLRNDTSPIAAFIVAASDRLGLLIYAGATSTALAIVGVIFSYLSTSLGSPLRDADLAAIDRAMGFDWPAFLAWTDARPAIARTLIYAYHTAGPQFALLYLFLGLTNRAARMGELLAINALCSLATGIGMTLVPAEGAYALYLPAVHTYGAQAGMWHHETLLALRNSATPILDIHTAQGLVTFPSYHTVLAIITTYAVRGVRWLFPATALLNAVVIVGTLTEGGHHLIDVIAGAAIAVVAIALVRWLSATKSEPAEAAADAAYPEKLA